MENIVAFTLALVLAELFEAYIQRADTFLGILKNLYTYYQKSIFLFFLVQPGFYIVLFTVLTTGVLNMSMIFLIALKIFDIFYKIELIKKVFIQQEIPMEIAQMLTWKIPSYFFLLGVMMYPPLLYYALM
jgi:hypothetical protein